MTTLIEWSCTSTPPKRLHDVDRGNFIFLRFTTVMQRLTNSSDSLPFNVPFITIIGKKLFHTCKIVTHHVKIFIFVTSVAVSRVNLEKNTLRKWPLQGNRDWSLTLQEQCSLLYQVTFVWYYCRWISIYVIYWHKYLSYSSMNC